MMETNQLINHPQFTKEGRQVAFSPETLKKVHSLIGCYPEGQKKSALLPILHISQEEMGGYLSVDVMDYVASLLDIQPIEVYEVATFFSMFYLDKVGKYVIEVCRTGPCAISGGEKILEHIQQKLGIKPGETTTDGIFSLKEVECLGSCGTGPVMQVNTEFHEKLTPAKIDRLIEELRGLVKKDKLRDTAWVEKFF
jgi:NADH-quinone oxidoreductase subunit E